MQLIGPPFGTGKDGYLTTSGTQDVNTRTACSGSSGATTLTVTSSSGFADRDLVMIHKSRGTTTTTCGTWEMNRLKGTPGGTTFYLDFPLAAAYQNSGANLSQVIRVPEYLNVLVPSATTLAPTGWGGVTGGITVFACSGLTKVIGSISANALGFRGQPAEGNNSNSPGGAGEGTVGMYTGWLGVPNNNGSGGGGGAACNSSFGGAGGGGNGSAGNAGKTGWAGSLSGDATLATMTFGGGGGGISHDSPNGTGSGGNGGGIIVIFSKRLIVTGTISTTGGTSTAFSGSESSSGGGGAGGSVLIKSIDANFGSSLVTATYGTAASTSCTGGNGAYGRVRIEANTLSGSTSPAYSSYAALVPWGGGVGIQG